MGGPAVQEWTLRVNILEAMLHAVLRTLKEEGKLRAEVVGMSPARVAAFWLGDVRGSGVGGGEEKRKGERAGESGGTNKNAKTDIVGRWLRSGKEISFQGEARKTRVAFLDRWEGKPRRGGKADITAGNDDDADAKTAITMGRK
ncbi:MAG: hypothetical protein M1814_000469 [Vezdaea aestivalis]|nr:MAG: hypothetical protein M1814_000469 [Vezdaea aestivalis]